MFIAFTPSDQTPIKDDCTHALGGNGEHAGVRLRLSGLNSRGDRSEAAAFQITISPHIVRGMKKVGPAFWCLGPRF